MRVLCVTPSTNQMYSGVGRNIFEQASRMTDRVQFEFAIDDFDPRNLALMVQFGAAHQVTIHIGTGRITPDFCDPVNTALPELLRQHRWDAIELHGWANAATHQVVLEELREEILCYTPHDQPLWTVPMSPAQAHNVTTIHRRVLQRAEVVLCVSPWERRQLQDHTPQRGHCVFHPNGCHFAEFRPGPLSRRPQLLFVGDLAEHRKRFDRVLAVFARLLERQPQFRLLVVGNRSEDAGHLIPPQLQPACELRGYVGEQELRQAYVESCGLLLFSDYEAFGIPILEALASGTPVFLTRQDETQSIFGSFRGAHFCAPDDLDGTAALIERTLARGPEAIEVVLEDRPRLEATFSWEILAARKWNALASAWFQRHGWRRAIAA
jgi:glycosyltransferase involved in cell wall biosynthesis